MAHKVSYIYQPDRILLKKYIQQFGSYITGKMLDVGAGETDRYARYFKYSERVTTDVQPGENVQVVAEAHDMPFDNASFDSVVCTQVLEHVPNQWKVVAEIGRVLKSGGYALISVPQTAELHEEPHDYWRYTKYGLIQLFTENGFDIVGIEQEGGFYTLMAQQRIHYCIHRFNLYERRFLGRIMSKLFALCGKCAMIRDARSRNATNKRYTIGYVMLARKLER